MISVIVASINRPTLARALRSVSAQNTSYPTEVIADIRDTTEGVQGISASRNAAVAQANGDYITILDDDDYWCDDYVQAIVPYLHSYDVILSPHISMGTTSLPADLTAYLRSGTSFPGGCLTIRKDAFYSVGGFNEHLPHSEVWELLLKLSKRAIVYSPKQTWHRTMDIGYHAGQKYTNRKIVQDRVLWQNRYVL